MAIKVKNIKGTGENAREISTSWLDYWKSEKNKEVSNCMAYDEDYTKEKSKVYRCGETSNLVGGHVKKVNSNDNKWYILPICTSHNKLNHEFWAREEDLVQASK